MRRSSSLTWFDQGGDGEAKLGSTRVLAGFLGFSMMRLDLRGSKKGLTKSESIVEWSALRG